VIASDFYSGGVPLRLLAHHTLKHGDIKAKERNMLKVRVL